MRDIWFWQRIISPHMAGLAVALAQRGCRVTYVAEVALSDDRKQLGWVAPSLEGVELKIVQSSTAANACLDEATSGSIHLCQGLRGNGYVRAAQVRLAARGLRQWVLMETVNDAGLKGIIKRAVYATLFRTRRSSLEGVLATGARTPAWVAQRGMPAVRVFPFTYFLRGVPAAKASVTPTYGGFCVGFVGQFIDRKCLPLLVDALASLADQSVGLAVVGSGPLEQEWRAYAEQRLPNRVRWIGGLPSAEVPGFLASVDCLVLPSRHDGWGAVVSEALMAGTPSICSDGCGAAEAVIASGVGGVFPNGDVADLSYLLAQQIGRGKVGKMERQRIADWASCLGANAGADYLLEILDHMDGMEPRPSAPWKKGHPACVA